MRRLALVAEGFGDVTALPSLVARVGQLAGQQIFACEPVIRAGEARRLRKPGEIERFVKLAASRDDADAVVVLLDLEDDCPAEFHSAFLERCAVACQHFRKPVSIVFAVREYETWFLHDIVGLIAKSNDIQWRDGINFQDPELIRGAKEALQKCMVGRAYKETVDQLTFTKRADLKVLIRESRSFRKFVKEVTNLPYNEIAELAI